MEPSAFILPIAGIVLIVVLVWAAGGYRALELSEAGVRAVLEAEGHRVDAIVVAADRRAALAWLDDLDRPAVVRSVGDHPVVTVPAPTDIREAKLDDATGELRFHFRSLAQPSVTMSIADSPIAPRLHAFLAGGQERTA